jgi:hypothetical protein
MPVKNNQVVAICGWISIGLPFGGIGVFVLLLRLGVLNFGGRSTGTGPSWPQNIGVQTPPAWSPQQAPTASQRQQILSVL